MSAKRTHRSEQQKKADAKLAAKRSRQEVVEEVEEVEVPLGQDDRKFHFDDKSRIEMVRLGLIWGAHEARRQWIIEYGEGEGKKVPSVATISSNVRKFLKTGCIHNQHQFADRSATRTACTEENKIAIYDRTVIDGQMESRQKRTSTRKFAAELGVAQSSVVKMTHELNLKSIKIHEEHSHQPLIDAPQRLAHSYWIVDNTNPDGSFKDNIIYFQSDESCRSMTSHMNRQNTREYIPAEDTRPVEYHYIQSLDKKKIHWWIALGSDGTLIEPIFYEGGLTGERYFTEIICDVVHQLEEREDFNIIHFQEDGAPCHRDHIVRAFMWSMFGDRHVALGNRISFPPRSPDLTVCDIWNFAYVKEQLSTREFATGEDLKAAIREVYAQISPEMIRNVFKTLRHRALACIEVEGGLFEGARKHQIREATQERALDRQTEEARKRRERLFAKQAREERVATRARVREAAERELQQQ